MPELSVNHRSQESQVLMCGRCTACRFEIPQRDLNLRGHSFSPCRTLSLFLLGQADSRLKAKTTCPCAKPKFQGAIPVTNFTSRTHEQVCLRWSMPDRMCLGRMENMVRLLSALTKPILAWESLAGQHVHNSWSEPCKGPHNLLPLNRFTYVCMIRAVLHLFSRAQPVQRCQ